MASGRLVVVVAGVGLMLAASASAGGRGTVVVRSSPRVVVQPNRIFAPGPFVARPEPSVFPRPVDPWRFWPPGAVFSRHGVVPFGTAAIGPSYPAIIGSGPVFAVNPPSVYGQPPVMTDGALPIPTVIEYPTGWYQLRGDGVNTPFVWVWIPKPPPAPVQPPAMVPPVPPPPVGSLIPDNSQSADAPARRKGLYRWVDEDGVAHWTDQRESIPQRYRAQAERR